MNNDIKTNIINNIKSLLNELQKGIYDIEVEEDSKANKKYCYNSF